MEPAESERPRPAGRLPWGLAAYAASAPALYAALRLGMAGAPDGAGLPAAFALAAPALVAILPLARASAHGGAAPAALARGATVLALLAAAIGAVAAATGGFGIGGGLALAVLLTSFGLLALALQCLARALAAPPAAAQALASAVALLLATTFFWIDPLLELARARPELRASLVRVAVDGNPGLVASANLLRVDLLKHRALYGRVSDLGAYYAYSYSPWTEVALMHTGIALVLALLAAGAEAARRLRRGRRGA